MEKNKISFRIFILFVVLPLICTAQSTPDASHLLLNPTLEQLASQADIIIEGAVIKTEGFQNNSVYTSATVKISRLFKGDISDSIIEIVYQGGESKDIILIASHGVKLSTEMSGMFFLKKNETGIRLNKNIQSYTMYRGNRSCARYNTHPQFGPRAKINDVKYDDFEKDLYLAIEAITHIPRMVFGLNTFEIEEAKKKR